MVKFYHSLTEDVASVPYLPEGGEALRQVRSVLRER